MIIPKKDRLAILTYLFKEGVCVAEKNWKPSVKHPEIDVPNLYVMNMMRSLASRGYVTAGFNWNHHYFFLTNEGIEYLREYLHLPEEIVPATIKRRPAGPRPGAARGVRGAQGEAGKEVAPAEGEFKPTFEGTSRGGFRGGRGGRGRGRGGRAGYVRETPQE